MEPSPLENGPQPDCAVHLASAVTRREALKTLAAAGLVSMAGGALGATTSTLGRPPGSLMGSPSGAPGKLPMTRLGRTGPQVTRICIGGWHIGEAVKADVAQRIIERSLELGVNFFDSAHSYGRGESERRYGRALKGKWDDVVIMTKSTERSAEGAERQIDESLERLGAPKLDLWQFHSINSVEDARRIAAKGGAVEAARKALADGRVKMIGATGHNSPEGLALLLSLVPEIEVCQFPVNAVDLHWKSFLKATLPVAIERKVGVLAMKTVAMGRLVGKAEISVAEAHAYALSHPVDVWVSGVESIKELEENCGLLSSFTPMTPAEMDRLVARAEPLKGPATEGYKQW